MIISAASDYRAAAQRTLPPFLFHYIDAARMRNIPSAEMWKTCRKSLCASAC